MSYSFKIKEDVTLLDQFLKQGLSNETHPHSYEKIVNISKLIEISYLENRKGSISDTQLEETIEEVIKRIRSLI